MSGGRCWIPEEENGLGGSSSKEEGHGARPYLGADNAFGEISGSRSRCFDSTFSTGDVLDEGRYFPSSIDNNDNIGPGPPRYGPLLGVKASCYEVECFEDNTGYYIFGRVNNLDFHSRSSRTLLNECSVNGGGATTSVAGKTALGERTTPQNFTGGGGSVTTTYYGGVDCAPVELVCDELVTTRSTTNSIINFGPLYNSHESQTLSLEEDYTPPIKTQILMPLHLPLVAVSAINSLHLARDGGATSQGQMFLDAVFIPAVLQTLRTPAVSTLGTTLTNPTPLASDLRFLSPISAIPIKESPTVYQVSFNFQLSRVPSGLVATSVTAALVQSDDVSNSDSHPKFLCTLAQNLRSNLATTYYSSTSSNNESAKATNNFWPWVRVASPITQIPYTTSTTTTTTSTTAPGTGAPSIFWTSINALNPVGPCRDDPEFRDPFDNVCGFWAGEGRKCLASADAVFAQFSPWQQQQVKCACPISCGQDFGSESCRKEGVCLRRCEHYPTRKVERDYLLRVGVIESVAEIKGAHSHPEGAMFSAWDSIPNGCSLSSAGKSPSGEPAAYHHQCVGDLIASPRNRQCQAGLCPTGRCKSVHQPASDTELPTSNSRSRLNSSPTRGAASILHHFRTVKKRGICPHSYAGSSSGSVGSASRFGLCSSAPETESVDRGDAGLYPSPDALCPDDMQCGYSDRDYVKPTTTLLTTSSSGSSTVTQTERRFCPHGNCEQALETDFRFCSCSWHFLLMLYDNRWTQCPGTVNAATEFSAGTLAETSSSLSHSWCTYFGEKEIWMKPFVTSYVDFMEHTTAKKFYAVLEKFSAVPGFNGVQLATKHSTHSDSQWDFTAFCTVHHQPNYGSYSSGHRINLGYWGKRWENGIRDYLQEGGSGPVVVQLTKCVWQGGGSSGVALAGNGGLHGRISLEYRIGTVSTREALIQKMLSDDNNVHHPMANNDYVSDKDPGHRQFISNLNSNLDGAASYAKRYGPESSSYSGGSSTYTKTSFRYKFATYILNSMAGPHNAVDIKIHDGLNRAPDFVRAMPGLNATDKMPAEALIISTKTSPGGMNIGFLGGFCNWMSNSANYKNVGSDFTAAVNSFKSETGSSLEICGGSTESEKRKTWRSNIEMADGIEIVFHGDSGSGGAEATTRVVPGFLSAGVNYATSIGDRGGAAVVSGSIDPFEIADFRGAMEGGSVGNPTGFGTVFLHQPAISTQKFLEETNETKEIRCEASIYPLTCRTSELFLDSNLIYVSNPSTGSHSCCISSDSMGECPLGASCTVECHGGLKSGTQAQAFSFTCTPNSVGTKANFVSDLSGGNKPVAVSHKTLPACHLKSEGYVTKLTSIAISGTTLTMASGLMTKISDPSSEEYATFKGIVECSFGRMVGGLGCGDVSLVSTNFVRRELASSSLETAFEGASESSSKRSLSGTTQATFTLNFELSSKSDFSDSAISNAESIKSVLKSAEFATKIKTDLGSYLDSETARQKASLGPAATGDTAGFLDAFTPGDASTLNGDFAAISSNEVTLTINTTTGHTTAERVAELEVSANAIPHPNPLLKEELSFLYLNFPSIFTPPPLYITTLSTSLFLPAIPNDTQLVVNSVSGFSVDDWVVIGDDASYSRTFDTSLLTLFEPNRVRHVVSLLELYHPLRNSYPSTTLVKRVDSGVLPMNYATIYAEIASSSSKANNITSMSSSSLDVNSGNRGDEPLLVTMASAPNNSMGTIFLILFLLCCAVLLFEHRDVFVNRDKRAALSEKLQKMVRATTSRRFKIKSPKKKFISEASALPNLDSNNSNMESADASVQNFSQKLTTTRFSLNSMELSAPIEPDTQGVRASSISNPKRGRRKSRLNKNNEAFMGSIKLQSEKGGSTEASSSEVRSPLTASSRGWHDTYDAHALEQKAFRGSTAEKSSSRRGSIGEEALPRAENLNFLPKVRGAKEAQSPAVRQASPVRRFSSQE